MPVDKVLEYIAVVFGILSVWFSRKENILVYPVGLVNTILYIYLSLKGHLIGEASVNLYYTIVSAWGWYLWTRKDYSRKPVLQITFSNNKGRWLQLAFFSFFFLALFLIITYFKKNFPGALPLPDAFAAASAYTGMWLMAKKKVESWYWWICTNIISIPLYYIKDYKITSIYYTILLILAFYGYAEWKRKALLNLKLNEKHRHHRP